jgi:hypothetical protein
MIKLLLDHGVPVDDCQAIQSACEGKPGRGKSSPGMGRGRE